MIRLHASLPQLHAGLCRQTVNAKRNGKWSCNPNIREGDWSERVPPVEIFLTTYINPWVVNTARTCFGSVVAFLVTSLMMFGTETVQCPLVIRIRSLPWLVKFCILITSPNITVPQLSRWLNSEKVMLGTVELQTLSYQYFLMVVKWLNKL